MAEHDKAYAWWASHLYQRLGASELNENALFKNLPEQLTAQINGVLTQK